eukprot:NODE_1926_length_1033_cov_236.745399.p1 GENE.NODE_1926_length_1033_cov_236.745399~~NODE_1926_length_1033_cov_236.745399.p1  ORF type:complete len:231 (+),score=35.03 NODE_1926_length_1033_cov_236.745399:3-695(+)
MGASPRSLLVGRTPDSCPASTAAQHLQLSQASAISPPLQQQDGFGASASQRSLLVGRTPDSCPASTVAQHLQLAQAATAPAIAASHSAPLLGPDEELSPPSSCDLTSSVPDISARTAEGLSQHPVGQQHPHELFDATLSGGGGASGSGSSLPMPPMTGTGPPAPQRQSPPRRHRAPRQQQAWCVVCMACPQEIAIDPCGHLSMCHNCASAVKDCPVCRGPIVKLLRVYIA